MPRVLIIGYGNPLRGDDNIGGRIARLLERNYRNDPDVRVIGSHQLTPEMAEDIAASEFVLFLDAASGPRAGEIQQVAVRRRPGPFNYVHCMDPASLLAAAEDLYGSVAQADLLTIAGATFELGDGLSPALVKRLPALFEKARMIVESHRHPAGRELRH